MKPNIKSNSLDELNNGSNIPLMEFLKSKLVAYNEAIDMNDDKYITLKSVSLKSAIDTFSLTYNLLYKESYSKDKKHIKNIRFYELDDLKGNPILEISK